MTRVSRAREARFRSVRVILNGDVHARVEKRKKKKIGKRKGSGRWHRARNGMTGGREGAKGTGEGGGGRERGGRRSVGRRWNHESVKMFCNFEIRRACWFTPKRVTGNRQPAGCGQRRHPPQKRIAVPPGNTH